MSNLQDGLDAAAAQPDQAALHAQRSREGHDQGPARDHARRAAGKLSRSGQKGANAIKFSGRIGARALKPGRYTLAITAVDAAGNRAAAKTVRIRVLAAGVRQAA